MAEVSVKIWTQTDEAMALEFLRAHEATSMFLLGNFESMGPRPIEHPHSGQFRTVWQAEELVGVFSATKAGNLLAQFHIDPPADEVIDLVIDTALVDQPYLQRVLGEWEGASKIWQGLKQRGEVGEPTLNSKENLYQLADLSAFSEHQDERLRFLGDDDFAEFLPLRRAFMDETKVSGSREAAEICTIFQRYCREKRVWGLFEDGVMVATTSLNARAGRVGQVGGVYTIPAMRKKGYSQAAMRAMLASCYREHGIRKMILFTGENNVAANALYRSLDFEKIGYFGLIFS